MKRNIVGAIIVFCSAFILACADASTPALVIPRAYQTNDGAGGSSVLYHAIRLQNVYSSSLFPSNKVLVIRELRYRPSVGWGDAFSATISNLQINLSTTTAAVDGLSATFANNVGTNDTVVFNGSIDLSSAFCGPRNGPKDFDIIIPLTTPFRYNPARGNLLIDYRNRSGSAATIIDSGVGNGASRVFALGANSTVAQAVDQGAEVVQLVYTEGEPDPEPPPPPPPGGGLVIPRAYTSQEGAGGSSVLYHGIRLQNVYAAGMFPANKVLVIRELRYRPSARDGRAFSATASDLQINLSTTRAAVGGLSATFANNVGSNDTVVFNGSINLSSAFSGPVGGPKAFDIVIPLTTPFRYDPSKGNLLIDYRNRSGSGATLIDSGVGNGASRVFALGAGSTAAQSVDQGAEIVQLVYTEGEPEPPPPPPPPGNGLVIPPAYTSQEGAGGSSVLFHAIRLQNVYASALFPTNKVLVIRELRYRPSARDGRAFSATISNIQINLSTTRATVGGLSGTFANNVGSNDTVVFNGSIHLSSAFSGPVGGPKAFDIVIPLTTPFRYDPSKGNLLIDYRNRSGSAATLIDSGVGNGASRAFALGASSTAAQSVDQGAEIVQLAYTEGEPEPPPPPPPPPGNGLVIPPAYTSQEGVGGSSVLRHGLRLQNVYASRLFPSNKVLVIRELRYRPSAIHGGAFSATISNIQINLSTTRAQVDELSTTFANNVGSNDTVVFNGSIHLSSAFSGPASGPKAFDIIIPLTTPFRYDPSKGNLLIDYRNRSGSAATWIDSGVGNGASRRFALGADSTEAPSGVDQGAEVVQLVYTEGEPEPPPPPPPPPGDGLVIPPAYRTTDSGGGSSVLYHELRLQNVYASRLFPSNKVLVIRELRYRPSVVWGGAFSTTISNIQINLSTTRAAVDGLSATFANNVGSNDTVVFNGSIHLSSAFSGPASGPKAFDIIIPLTTPFRYDPSKGNLLIDYRNRSGSGATIIDAGVANGASRVFSLGADSTVAQAVDQGAEVVQLVYSEGEPEPPPPPPPGNGLVMPPAYTSQEGVGGSSLLRHEMRMQDVYASQLFPSNKVLVIRELRYRPSAIHGSAFSAAISNIQINLSTTRAAASGLSANFANNVGSNDTVVFNGSVNLSSTFSGPAGGPKAFDIIIPLTTPFRYDPSKGNLLIDYRNRSGSVVTWIDSGVGNGGSRAWSLGANSTTAQSVDPGIEVVQLIYTEGEPGPEPASPPPVIASFTPRSGPTGTVVTITGSNFHPSVGDNRVNFGGVQARVLSASTNVLTVEVPIGATYEPISVNTRNRVAFSALPFVVTFASSRTINSDSFRSFNLPAGDLPMTVSIGDMEGNGKLDLVALNYQDSTVGVYLNDRTNFTLRPEHFGLPRIYPAGPLPYHMALADVDGAGGLDVVTANRGDNTVSVRRNTPAGIFAFAPAVSFPVGQDPVGLATGDLDKDGRVDIVVANNNSDSITILRQTGDPGPGTNAPSFDVLQLPVGDGPHNVVLADIDGDSRPDIVVANYHANTMSILRNLTTGPGIGPGSFAPEVTFAPGGNCVAFGDLDGDGRGDLAIAEWNSQVLAVYRNVSSPGTIALSEPATFAIGNKPYTIALSDLDGDARVDLSIVGQLPSFMCVFKNVGSSGVLSTNSFAPRVDFPSGWNPVGLSAGDLNGDGRPDLVFANAYDDNLTVYVNEIPGGGTNQPTLQITEHPQSQTVQVGGTAIFRVGVTGTPPIGYRWRRNGITIVPPPGSDTLIISNVQPSHAGNYSVVVTNAASPGPGLLSSNAVLTVIGSTNTVAPQITEQPRNQTVPVGGTATFAVQATGTLPLAYVWFKGDLPVGGATNRVLTLTNVQTNHAGRYSVRVSNSAGTATSQGATLTVNSVGGPGTNCVPRQGLVSWWRADGNPQDSIGSNHGTVQGATFAAGKHGQAFSFDGDDRIAVPDSDSLEITPSLSVEGWVKIRNWPSQNAFGAGMVVYRGDDRSGLDPFYIVVLDSGVLRFAISAADGAFAAVDGPVVTNEFIHFAGTLDDASGAMKLYLNGALVTQSNTTVRPVGDLGPFGSGLGIGHGQNGTGFRFGFDGLVDELKLYSRALTAAEIQMLYTNAPCSDQPPPPPAADHDLSRDFRIDAGNPNGVWSYGWKGTLGGPFNLFTFSKTYSNPGGPPMEFWEKPWSVPSVIHNNSTDTVITDGGQGVFPPETTVFYPGVEGEPENFGVIRFTVPSGGGGTYDLATSVRPAYSPSLQKDTDFHVLKNGVELFGRALNVSDTAEYTSRLELVAGDTIDFVIGRGADNSFYWSGLKIEASLKSIRTAAHRISMAPVSGGRFTFCLAPASSSRYVVETSTNMVDWTVLTDEVAGNGLVEIADPRPVTRQRFYRARLTP